MKTLLALITFSLFTACTNQMGTGSSIQNFINKTEDEMKDEGVDMLIHSVVIEGQDGSDGLTTNIYFDSQKSQEAIGSYCTEGGCSCEFTWVEVNDNTGAVTNLTRRVKSDLESIQSFVVTCDAPAVFSSEILDGTRIRISVVKEGGKALPSIKPFSFFKGDQEKPSDFRDNEGNGFSNIYRYSCYEYAEKDMSLRNRVTEQNDGTYGKRDLLLASHFCTSDTEGEDCVKGGGYKPSSESFYYNLFIKSHDRGAFSLHNQRFSCPVVKEPINPAQSAAEENRAWPLDSQFALANRRTASFTVPVVAPSVLSITSDNTTAPETCLVGDQAALDSGPQSSGQNSGTSISPKCLGFAKRPNSNGTCPEIRNTGNQPIPTFRLRRFIAPYPVTFNSRGDFIAQSRPGDVVYVVDRPVRGIGGSVYTMQGPKPCPFAYLDHSGATQRYGGALGGQYQNPNRGVPAYLGTNDPRWAGKNVDGVHFPNFDDPKGSCSAAMPMIEFDLSGNVFRVSLGTSHQSNPGRYDIGGGRSIPLNKIYVRGIQPWWPHYVEDKSFEACVPLSTDFKDPPLHFERFQNDPNRVAWCAEAYPTQNSDVAAIDRNFKVEVKSNDLAQGNYPTDAFPGYFKPFTSHVVKNSSSPGCNATPVSPPSKSGSSNWPGGGGGSCAGKKDSAQRGGPQHAPNVYADQNGGTALCAPQTCDRTVVSDDNADSFVYPLLAPPWDVESVLKNDPSYVCNVTWDEKRDRTRDQKSPAGGCCVAVSGYPAHTEPLTDCGTPVYQ